MKLSFIGLIACSAVGLFWLRKVPRDSVHELAAGTLVLAPILTMIAIAAGLAA